MCVIYLLQEGLKARKNGGRLIVEKEQKVVSSTPILQMDFLVIGMYAQITTQVIFSLIENKIPVFYIDWKGRIAATLKDESVTVNRLLKQISVMQNEGEQLRLAKYVIKRKLDAQKQIIDIYAKSRKKNELKEIAHNLKLFKDSIEKPILLTR